MFRSIARKIFCGVSFVWQYGKCINYVASNDGRIKNIGLGSDVMVKCVAILCCSYGVPNSSPSLTLAFLPRRFPKSPSYLSMTFSFHVFSDSYSLTCKGPGWYLNCSTWFIKNINIIWTLKDKLWNKWHFMENETNLQHFFKMQYFLVAQMCKINF